MFSLLRLCTSPLDIYLCFNGTSNNPSVLAPFVPGTIETCISIFWPPLNEWMPWKLLEIELFEKNKSGERSWKRVTLRTVKRINVENFVRKHVPRVQSIELMFDKKYVPLEESAFVSGSNASQLNGLFAIGGKKGKIVRSFPPFSRYARKRTVHDRIILRSRWFTDRHVEIHRLHSTLSK